MYTGLHFIGIQFSKVLYTVWDAIRYTFHKIIHTRLSSSGMHCFFWNVYQIACHPVYQKIQIWDFSPVDDEPQTMKFIHQIYYNTYQIHRNMNNYLPIVVSNLQFKIFLPKFKNPIQTVILSTGFPLPL